MVVPGLKEGLKDKLPLHLASTYVQLAEQVLPRPGGTSVERGWESVLGDLWDTRFGSVTEGFVYEKGSLWGVRRTVSH